MNIRYSCVLTLACLAAFPAHAQQRGTSAREAVDMISAQFGPRAVQWIAEIQGRNGIPQPTDWEILAYDERAPRLLYRFWAGNGRAGDGGIDQQRYPLDIPVGYFSASQIGVDSVAAFTIAEGEARKARMAFDSCNYMLRVKDFSNEPFWRLELLNAAREVVGKVYVSATTGNVMRTLWVYRDQRARPDGLPLIVDSYAPTQQGFTSTTDLSRNTTDRMGIHTQVPSFNPVPGETGITSVPSVPTDSTSPTVPVPPAPRMTVPPSIPPSEGQSAYRPVDPGGRPVSDGIPEPPALTREPEGTAVAESSTGAPMRDLRDETPATPKPSEVPDVPESSGGSSDRIPPPPIPR